MSQNNAPESGGNAPETKASMAVFPIVHQTPEEIILELDAQVTRLRNALLFAASWIETGRPLEGLAERMREAADETSSAKAEPLASYEPLVQATTGVRTGEYQLTVGDLLVRTEQWDKEVAEKWLPIIVAAVNAYGRQISRLKLALAKPGLYR